MSKLDPRACGLALGILWAGSILFMGLTAMVCSWAQPFVDAVSVIYVGYNTSIAGIFIGAIRGFVDAFIGGIIFVWLYNRFSK